MFFCIRADPLYQYHFLAFMLISNIDTIFLYCTLQLISTMSSLDMLSHAYYHLTLACYYLILYIITCHLSCLTLDL